MRDAVRDEQGRLLRPYHWETMVGSRRVELRFALVEGRLVCIGVEIGPPLVAVKKGKREWTVFDIVDEGELDPLRATEIRLPLGDLVDRALEKGATLGEGLAPETAARFERHREAAKAGRKRPGRPRMYSDDHYREVARIYEETLRSGRRDPLQAVMRELQIAKTTAASKVREARRRGILTMTYFTEEQADAE